MNPFRIPSLGKLVLGGAGSALLGVALAGSPALAATSTPKPAQATAAKAKHDHPDRRLIFQAIFNAEAAVLGLKPEELRAALKNGKTVEQLARAKGMNKEQFGAKLATAAQPALDKLVNDKFTKEKEQKLLAAIRAGHIPFWNGIHHHHPKK